MEIVLIVVIALVLLIVVATVIGFTRGGRSGDRSSTTVTKPKPGVDYPPGVGDDAAPPRDTPKRPISDLDLPETEPSGSPGITLDRPDVAAGRMARLRQRLSRSGALGQGLFALLSRDHIDDQTWDEIEETLIGADLGVSVSTSIVDRLREQVRIDGTADASALRSRLREELLTQVNPALDRTLSVSAVGRPAIVLVVGVNGTGKTTTTGKLARVLVAEDKDVVLGAADTFRAAASEQLQTWGDRVGVPVVRGPEGGDPASVAFETVQAAIANQADVVLIDTAGRLHTKTGLMDELGKVKRVVEKQSPVDEVLLVLDATTGQNGMLQAKVFAEAVDVTGVVLTKLDGTAKGGIVIAVQNELNVPVKLVGLGEGADDLAPFDPEVFVDALLG